MNAYSLPATGPLLASEADATDLIGEMYGSDTDAIVIPVSRLKPEVFTLSNGLLGHFLQKLINYRVRVALVGDIAAHTTRSKPLRDFVHESNKSRHVRFAADESELAGWL
jgi:hypothetical protein